MRLRHLLHLLWIPLALSLVLAALYFLAYTPRGLNLVAAQFSGLVGPVRIQLQGASGTLAGGAHLDRLIIDHRRVHIEIEDVSGRIAIPPLAWQMIRVPELRAAHLLIHVLPNTGEHAPWVPHFLPTLMRIMAERVEVQHWQLIASNGVELEATAASASAAIYPGSARIYAAALDFHGVHLRGSGEVRAATSIGLTGDVHADARPEGQPPWTVNARLDGNLAHLQVDARVSEPFAAEFHGAAEDLTTRWHWQGHSNLRRLDLTLWHLGNGLGLINGPLDLQGDRDGFAAHGALTPQALHVGAFQTEFTGSFKAPVLSITHLGLRHAPSGTAAQAQGSLTLTAAGPQLDLHGDWNHFRWPLAASDARAGDAGVTSDHGRYTLSGTHVFDISAQGELRVAALPSITIVNLRGQLAAGGLRADSAEISSVGARAQLSGALHWGASESTHGWQVQGHIEDLELAPLRPGTVGRVNFTFNAAGSGFNAQSDLQARLSELSGNVRGQRAEGHGEFQHRAGVWTFREVQLQLGATRLALDGRIGSAAAPAATSSVDLNFSLDADDLALLHAGAHGRLQAHGKLTGERNDLTLLSTAKLQEVDWNGLHLDALEATIAFDPHGSGRNDSKIEVQGLAVAGRRLEHLALRTEGTTALHSVALDARGEGIELALRGSGRYGAGQWQEQIEHAQISDGRNLHMSLEAPAALSVAFDRLHLETMCLRDELARLCGSASFESAQRKISLRASNLPMRTLTAGLTAATDYEGTLTVTLEGSDSADAPWRGSLNAQLAHAAVRKHFANGRVETLNLGDGLVRAELSEHDLSAGLGLDAGSAGLIEAHLQAHAPGGAGSSDVPWRDWPLTGDVKLDSDAVGFAEAYVSQIDRASGRLHAQMALTGSAAAPQLNGELSVTGAQLDAYQVALSLRELNFHARLSDDTLQIDGAANCGPDGHATVSGSLRWQQGQPFGDLHLKGTDLRVINLPEARVDASPDVALHLQGQRIDIQGQVALPYARIEPANLTNAVLSSSDEVIVGQSAPARAGQFKVYSDITLLLGERVTVNTAGLSGRLSGSIRVATDDTGISRGSGELKVEEGKYLAYGRNLDIQHGRLLFSNGLMGDPGLDLRAVKKFPDITAGVNVRGTLRQPRMTFFSDPEVAQSQIVSLLLAGGSLQTVQNTTTNTDPVVRNAASRGDLMQGGAILAQQIGGRYNIEAGVEQDLDNETSLVLGRYLSPRLYVSYGVGLAEAINTIKMRYTIGDHWTVKTEGGTHSGADLVYTIER
jgi:translocation and assembly module TamB